MKKLLSMAAAAILLFSACKKDETNAPVSNESTWTLAGVNYKATITYKAPTSQNDILLNFWDGTPSATVKVNSVALSFKQDPTTSGTYQLIGYGTTPVGKQFTMAAGTKEGAAYAYIGANPVDVTVTVVNGKIKAIIPEVTLKGASGNPDAKFTATLQEM
jgi:hypothetical protein